MYGALGTNFLAPYFPMGDNKHKFLVFKGSRLCFALIGLQFELCAAPSSNYVFYTLYYVVSLRFIYYRITIGIFLVLLVFMVHVVVSPYDKIFLYVVVCES
jgi:hypothetical protein